jgi:hypothetical protein
VPRGPRIRNNPPVRLALTLALAATALVALAIVLLAIGSLAWWVLLVLCAGALALGIVATSIGVLGWIRFGLFTEGFGRREIDADRREASISRAAGALGEASIFAAVALAVVTAVLHIAG